MAAESEFSSVGVTVLVLVLMRGSALTHTRCVLFISQVALRGNGCGELWPACLRAVLSTDPALCRQVGAPPEGSTKQRRHM